MENAGKTNEEKLEQLLQSGRITREEYERLSASIRPAPKATLPHRIRPWTDLPWQVWVVIALLALEGLGNLVQVPSEPMAGVWLTGKVIIILGLIRIWRPVYVASVVLLVIHVLYFAIPAPAVAAINALLLVLLLMVRQHYFPAAGPRLQVN